MLAVSKGRLIEMSSPNGKRGHFYENWQHGVGVERIKIIGRQCPRIGAEFLDKMRQKLGPVVRRVDPPRPVPEHDKPKPNYAPGSLEWEEEQRRLKVPAVG